MALLLGVGSVEGSIALRQRKDSVLLSGGAADSVTESLALLRSRWRQNLMNHNRHQRRGVP